MFRFQDSMRNVIGQRQTELALTTGKMFMTDEALKVGLVDELATDKADAISKAEKFISTFKGISGQNVYFVVDRIGYIRLKGQPRFEGILRQVW